MTNSNDAIKWLIDSDNLDAALYFWYMRELRGRYLSLGEIIMEQKQ